MLEATPFGRDVGVRPAVSLAVIDVPRPCEADWAAMVAVDGNRVRHCGRCDKHVYNLSALPRVEAERFLAERFAVAGGDACVRLYKRADGTVVTADCGGRWRAAAGRRVGAWAGAVGAACSLVVAVVWGGGTGRAQVPLMGSVAVPVPATGPATVPATVPSTRPSGRPPVFMGKVAVRTPPGRP